MTFKIVFPSGYQTTDIINDNIDINIILANGDIYWGTLFTVQNLQHLMTKDTRVYFWATDMVIVNDLSKSTIRYAVSQVLEDDYMEKVFSKIGNIADRQHLRYSSFELIEDMSSFWH